ncbi:unnamed protein product [Penicillium olsonii]|uniref:Zn(2)-C6 fungal-type domain-containing protein n=1 Tax=Penicillium olsonii TaxID=99116 RepID=A0A9W4N3E1_PENOL|nr:unnamed protein product [Penicillium olsonii]CAG8241611.1 unnamed protein product [Penicillium olsonii]
MTDEGKPLCHRCHKAGFECGGYVDFVEFIDETSRIKRNSLQRLPGLAPNPRSSDSSEPQSKQVVRVDFNSDLHFPLTVNPSWNEHEIMTTYLFREMFDWDLDSIFSHAPAWDSILLGQDSNAELSTTSVRALSTVYFAKTNKQAGLMRKGARLYADALRLLRAKIQSQEAIGDDVLIAIILLGTYELICLTHPRAWISHYEGLAKLIALRGPYRHQSGIGLAIMPTIRSCIAIGYIVERKRCFLEEPAWKTIPWAKQGLHSKTPTDLLHDVLCDIPGILEDLSSALVRDPNVPGNLDFTSRFIPRVLSTLDTLYSWRWNWESQFPKSTFITNPIKYNDIPLLPSPFKSIIWFANPHRATELIVYNAIRLILTRSLQIAGIQQEHFQPQVLSDPLLPMEGNRNDIATEICRMTDYHLSCFRQGSAAFSIVFPLNVAYLHLDPSATAIRSWLESVMAVIADFHGFEIGRSENTPRKADDVHGGLQ